MAKAHPAERESALAEVLGALRLLGPAERTRVRLELAQLERETTGWDALVATGAITPGTGTLEDFEPIVIDTPRPISELLVEERR